MKIASTCLALSLSVCAATQAGTGYDRAGWVADLTTLAHNVSGRVTILDASTLLVENFTYDGGGLSVYFYLGAMNDVPSFTNGVRLGPQLFGTPYSNGTLILRVPAGVDLDGYNAISVWCEVANANFGSDSFSAPTAPRMILSALPGEVSAGQALTFATSEGAANRPLILFAVDVSGMPVFVNLTTGLQDGAGEWCWAPTVPSGLAGLSVDLVSFGWVTPTMFGASNRARVSFL